MTRLARRAFLTHAGRLAGAAAVLGPFASSLTGQPAMAVPVVDERLLHDTMNGFVAFIVPGPDEYSVAQGVSTAEAGGVDAHAADFLIGALKLSAPFVPDFASTVAGILNDIASQVNQASFGPFPSPFARLSFAEKARALAVMEEIDPLKPLAGILPAIVAFVTYSEGSVFDPVTRTLTEQPIGWRLARYDGVADGRNDFQGYFHHRRVASA